jgi:hypothetical protein
MVVDVDIDLAAPVVIVVVVDETVAVVVGATGGILVFILFAGPEDALIGGTGASCAAAPSPKQGSVSSDAPIIINSLGSTSIYD